MSLTGSHHGFSGVPEHASNVFLQAFFTARPHSLTDVGTYLPCEEILYG